MRYLGRSLIFSQSIRIVQGIICVPIFASVKDLEKLITIPEIIVGVESAKAL